jgi:hypothetical protein
MKIKLVSLAVATAVAVAASGAALASRTAKAPGVRYTFSGHLLAAPSSSSLSLQVEGGSRAALRKMLGQSQNQSFSYGASTEFLRWTNGVPTVVTAANLAAGDRVTIHVRAPRNATLAQIEATAPAVVADRGPNPANPVNPLFLFRGTLAGVGNGSVSVQVKGGNRRALRLLVGQSAQQSFTTGANTMYLLWQGKVPTVVSASQLKVGDRVTVRVRAPKGSTLAQVEATAAVRVAEHEPAA